MKVETDDRDPRTDPQTIVPSPAFFLAKRLKCPIEAINVEKKDLSVYRASGCGIEQLYRYRCENDACAWAPTKE
jgi:hypothetical protein